MYGLLKIADIRPMQLNTGSWIIHRGGFGVRDFVEIVEAKARTHAHRWDRRIDEVRGHKGSLRRAKSGNLSGREAKYWQSHAQGC